MASLFGITNTTPLPILPPVGFKRKSLLTELVPYTCWYSNCRDHLTTKQWDAVKDWCYKRAGYRCEICGETGLTQGSRKWNVEAHEIWNYEYHIKKQTLIGLIALCPLCHECKHYGRALILGIDAKVRRRLAYINSWSLAETDAHCKGAIETYKLYSECNWTLNLDYLKEEFGLDIAVKRTEVELSDEERLKISSMQWKAT